ncbi:MAG: hypothetical protein ACXABY_26540 [Candidatus Thorarchaeota archaeon]|jgi:hypothetical protein
MSDNKGIVVDFEEAKQGLEIPKSPQYACFQEIQRVLEKHGCVLMIKAGLEQIGPNVYKLFANPQIREKAPGGQGDASL